MKNEIVKVIPLEGGSGYLIDSKDVDNGRVIGITNFEFMAIARHSSFADIADEIESLLLDADYENRQGKSPEEIIGDENLMRMLVDEAMIIRAAKESVSDIYTAMDKVML